MKQVEVFAFRVPNDIPGRKPYLTRWKMTVEEAEQRWPGAAVPEMMTREIRTVLTTPEEIAHVYRSPDNNHKPTSGEVLREYDERLKKQRAEEAAARSLLPEPVPEPVHDQPLTDDERWLFGRPTRRR